MMVRSSRRCDFCGVPFPEEKTPYKPILRQDPKGKNLAFCCSGCFKAYKKISSLAQAQSNSLLSVPNPIFSSSAYKYPVPSPGSSLIKPYQHLVERAIEYGATRAVLTRAADVLVDLRAKLKCYVPICRRLGTNLCCPPFSPSVQETRHLRDSYEYALLIQCEGRPEEFTYESCQQGLQLRYYLRLNNIVSAIESCAQKEGYYLAMGFGGGHCKLCGCEIDPKIKCAGVMAGKPLWNRCRYPLRARPAMESVGIDVFATARKAGLSVNFYGITSPVEKVPSASSIGIVFIN